MRFAPLAACVLIAYSAAVWAQDSRTAAIPAPELSQAQPPFKPDPALAALLAPANFTINADKSITKAGAQAPIDYELLQKADYEFNAKGQLVYTQTKGLVETHVIVKVLEGLLPFASAKARSPKDVGKILRSWGVPDAFDGKHLVNPDGSATYFGLMLYEGMKNRPLEMTTRISGQRLTTSLNLFQSAFSQAFSGGAPDVAFADLARAWDMLAKSKAGETPIAMTPGAGPNLAEYRDKLKGLEKNDAPEDLKAAIAALNQLERTRYHAAYDLGNKEPPPPQIKAAGEKAAPDAQKATAQAYDPDAKSPPPQYLLAKLLTWIDKTNGTPIPLAEKERLIKAFPMGETVWRMGAEKLWKEAITGKGTKIGVIDTGVGDSQDFGGRVKSRDNFTLERGRQNMGTHATHVAGTILALAPDAEIRSYRALSEDSFSGNSRLQIPDDSMLARAIDKAVADGNDIINMSLGGGFVGDDLGSKIDRYAREKGVIFVIAAGNSGRYGPIGVNPLSAGPDVYTIGSLDANNRVSRFSSFGNPWDPVKFSYRLKNIFMAPGQNIVSSVVPFSSIGGEREYQALSGTSMAAPHASGTIALLVQQARELNNVIDPLTLSALIKEVLGGSSKLMSARDVPPDMPPDQDLLIIDPVAASKLLKQRQTAVAEGGKKTKTPPAGGKKS